MSASRKLSRRQFVKLAGATAAGAVLSACGPAATPTTSPTSVPPTSVPPTTAPTVAPTVVTARKVRIAVGGWAEQNMKDLLAKTDFTKQTGIDVEIVLRTDTKETELTRLAS